MDAGVVASKAAVADAAWARLCEVNAAESARRTNPQSPARAAASDEAVERWQALQKIHFLLAWRHVSSMLSGSQLRDEYASLLVLPSSSTVRKTLEALAVDVSCLNAVTRSEEGARAFREQLSAIEGVLVACLGHFAPRPRATAIRLLNVLYDGTDWQLHHALPARLTTVGQAFTVDIYTLPPVSSAEDGGADADESIRVCVSAPCYQLPCTVTTDTIITLHKPRITRKEVWVRGSVIAASASVPALMLEGGLPSVGSGSEPSPQQPGHGAGAEARAAAAGSQEVLMPVTVTHVQLDLAPFTRCGFFDWRVLCIAGDGTATPLSAVVPLSPAELAAAVAAGKVPPTALPANGHPAPSPLAGMMSPGGSWAGSSIPAGAEPYTATAQGRYIVHRANAAHERWHEVVVDLEGMRFGDNGEVIKHGTFDDVAASVRGLAETGVSSLFVLGAIERDTGWGETEAATAAAAAAAHGGVGGADGGGHHRVPGSGVSDTHSDNNSAFFHLDMALPSDLSAGLPGVPAQPVALTSPFAHLPPLPSGDFPPGMRSYAARPDANPHAVVDRLTPNRMLGGPMGLSHLVREGERHGVRVVVQCDASVSASRPHRKYRSLYARTLSAKGQSVVHHGTDSLENQWEDTQLLNYRKVEAWDLLISDAKTLVQNFGIGGLYLTDAQSYPFIQSLDTAELFRRDVDNEAHYSAREILEGEIVIANQEVGFWSSRLAHTYPNPLLVKLCRALWQIAPDFTVVGESHWGRAGALARSGILPHGLDLINAVANTLGRSVNKNGKIDSVSFPPGVSPVHLLRALLGGEADGRVPPQAAPHYAQVQESRGYPNPLTSMVLGPGGALPVGAQQLQIRSLSSARMPYPALLLGRSAWTAVDLLFTLPGSPMTFQDETTGRAYRVDITGTYRHNEAYMEEEKRKREKRLAAEKHSKRAWASAGGAGGAGGPGQPMSRTYSMASRLKDAENTAIMGVAAAAVAAAAAGVPSGPVALSGADPASWFEGHVGAGGVVPASAPHDMKPASGYGMSRTGFSHLNLQELAYTAAEMATTTAPAAVPASSGGPTIHTGRIPHAAATAAAPAARGGQPPLPGPALRKKMPSVSSSPALQNLLLGGVFDSPSGEGSGSGGGSGGDVAPWGSTPQHSLHTVPVLGTQPSVVFDMPASRSGEDPAAAYSGGMGGGFSHGAPTGPGFSELEEEDYDSEDDEGLGGEFQAPAELVHSTSGFGFHLVQQQPAAAGRKGRRAGRTSRGGAPAERVPSTSPPADDMRRIQSWAVIEGDTAVPRILGDKHISPAAVGKDSAKAMQEMEARLRAEVGPEYGFDLAQIGAHYAHRQLCRLRYPALRWGDMTALVARHRFGEHGHVLSFGRSLPGQVAVVALNFNGHPSTFAVDCSPLAQAFGATSTSDASASVAQLMAASNAVGEITRQRLISALTEDSDATAAAAAAKPGPKLSLSTSAIMPTLNLRGGVWEVRDVFESDIVWSAPAAEQAAVAAGQLLPLQAADGPLVAILAADEAAYAPMMTSLQPHRSYCWLYSAARGVGSSTTAAERGMHSPTATRLPDRESETDSASMQWLFASSLLRLQAMLRLKESGLATAVITRGEVEAAGGYAALMAKRELGAGEPWISPGEMLKDEEIQAAVRHNLVYSLLRHVAKRSYRALQAARRSPPSGEDTQAAADTRMKAAVGETAALMDSALRVFVTHFKLRGGSEGEGAPLMAEPLPRLHADSDGTSPMGKKRDPAWYCIDPEAAVTILRAALFLAVKDVVAQAATVAQGGAGAAASAAAAAASPASTSAAPASDVSDEDAALSALLLKGLVRVIRGQVTGSYAAEAARKRGEDAGFAAGDASLIATELSVMALARRLHWRNHLGPIVFVTPELGKWSTVGGLGVMVDELSVGLAELGAEVICISPYYNVNRKGVADYLRADGIAYTGRNVTTWVNGERIDMGVHEGVIKDVRVLFLHNSIIFPKPYPSHDAYHQVRVMSAFSRATLEVLCQWRLIPSLIITNDWFTGMVPAYARNPRFFGTVFNRTDFMHICHNLDPDYEGRMWPDPSQGTLHYLHELDSNLLVDPYWSDVVINPTRAALLCSDTWATVSRSYRADLLSGSPLKALLRLAPQPFAHPNGIPVKARLARMASLPFSGREEAKAHLQRKYFGFERADMSIPLFAFVGRITLQKGVHLILQAVEQLLHDTGGNMLFLVGGMASESDSYGKHCAGLMNALRVRHGGRFWADPSLFFTDGDVVNLGADFCMMPSMFEPGGIVQQEFFVAGTPVVAFKTGGLKDTVHEYNPEACTGNGFVFESHTVHDFTQAIKRALVVFHDRVSYARLRQNARDSVIDLKTVAEGWYREFHRVRRCLPSEPRKPAATVPVTFTLRVNEVPGCTRGSSVMVAGSFTGWKPAVALSFVPATQGASGSEGLDRFVGRTQLAPGTYTYKFVLDGGLWTTAPSSPVATDETGNINNIVSVVPPPAAAEDCE